MKTHNGIKSRIAVLLAVFMLSIFAAMPAFARSAEQPDSQVGIASIVMPKVETLSMEVVKHTNGDGSVRFAPVPSQPQAKPLYPMGNYTCYYESIRIPCHFLAWLWY